MLVGVASNQKAGSGPLSTHSSPFFVVLDPFDRPGVIASDDRKLRCARTFELLQFCKTRKQLSALQEIKSRSGDASKICTRDSPSARLRNTFDPYCVELDGVQVLCGQASAVCAIETARCFLEGKAVLQMIKEQP